MRNIILLIIAIFVAFGIWKLFGGESVTDIENPQVPEETETETEIPADIQAHIDSKSDLIRLESPAPFEIVKSPMTVSGEARGYWYFEGDFPVTLTNWDGLIIAEGYASFIHDPNDPESTWMTEEFVPFEGTVTFTNPSFPDTEAGHFSKRGYLILKRSNPSGLPENDNALEIPVMFE